ncbi:MAG: L,D-transpeptidase family protein [Alphaproteobacteria bacterium]
MRHSFAFALAAAALVCASGAQAAVQITIDKSTQQMTVEKDGRPLYVWPVSTGRPGFDTPSGKFKAFRMEKDHFSKEWDDAPMPFSIFFTQKGHAIHGYLDTKNIGRPASHGCVRLTPANAQKLFALVEEDGVLNTTVILTGTTPSRAPAVAKRQLPRPDELDQGYVQQQQPAYGNPSYAQQPQYGQPYYQQPQYGQPQYAQQPQYGQPTYQPQYAQPQYAQPQYAQPQYAQPQPRTIYRDQYGNTYQARPPGTLFP